MANIIQKPSWQLHENDVTPEQTFRNRRDFLKTIGLGSLALAGISSGSWAQNTSPLPSFVRNPDYADPGRMTTTEELTTTFNNFYEFGFSKSAPAHNAKGFSLDPYTLKIGGLVDKPTECIHALQKRILNFIECSHAFSII